MALADRIKEARKRAKLTQDQAATAIGVAKSTWSGYEIGNSTPDIEKFARIMDLLNVDANFLWQDYFVNKETPAPDDARDKNLDIEATTRALIAMGFIKEGEQLSDHDFAFLGNAIASMRIWFAKEKNE